MATYRPRDCRWCGAKFQPASSRETACSFACRMHLIVEPTAVDLDACWPWPLSKNKVTGYGQVAEVPGRIVGAHRAAYAVFTGDVPAGMNVCHSCDNPACCNPAHLFLGSDADNVNDMHSKGRAGIRRFHSGDQHWTRRRPDLLNCRFSAEEARKIAAEAGSRRAIAARYSAPHSLIGRIKRGDYGSTKGSADKTALLAKK